MLNLYPAYVAWHYYLFITVAALATVQAAAGHAGLRGLQIGGRLWPRRLTRAALATAWVGGAAAFVRSSPDFVSPGLAGAELIAMFGAGTMTALALSLVGGLPRGGPQPQAAEPAGQVPLSGGASYSLRLPPARPQGVVLLLADPDLPLEATEPLARAVLGRGYACALVSWQGGVPVYLDALAVVPLAMSGCRVSCGDGGVVLIGMGAAADLALRAASEHDEVDFVAAVAPALRADGVLDGLLLLREMSLPAAWRWRGRWDRAGWVRSLRSDQALATLGERAAVLASRADGFFELPPDVIESGGGFAVRVEDEAGHRQLVEEMAPGLLDEWLQPVRVRDAAGA